MLKLHFLENRIIQIKDILKPIDEYFWKFDFNAETQTYELFLGVPKDWLHDMKMENYKIDLVNENENGKIVKIVLSSEEHVGDLDEMVLFAIDIIQRNNAILAKIREKESELQIMKDKMVEVQMALDREIEKLKEIKSGNEPEVEEIDDSIGTNEPVEWSAEKLAAVQNHIKTVTEKKRAKKEETKIETTDTTYVAPISMSQEEADKFVELVRNGKG